MHEPNQRLNSRDLNKVVGPLSKKYFIFLRKTAKQPTQEKHQSSPFMIRKRDLAGLGAQDPRAPNSCSDLYSLYGYEVTCVSYFFSRLVNFCVFFAHFEALCTRAFLYLMVHEAAVPRDRQLSFEHLRMKKYRHAAGKGAYFFSW